MNSFDEEVHEATDESDEEMPPKRIALHQTSVPRYHKVQYNVRRDFGHATLFVFFFCDIEP